MPEPFFAHAPGLTVFVERRIAGSIRAANVGKNPEEVEARDHIGRARVEAWWSWTGTFCGSGAVYAQQNLRKE
jgi:hypothetical protein